ncbi:YjcZ family sporulation protein [Salibacterium halotolerans]|nr:YjcZ family sporulation protein [Salibacterium halotolerans]
MYQPYYNQNQTAGYSSGGKGAGKAFALIVVLFILLVIVGASKTDYGYKE